MYFIGLESSQRHSSFDSGSELSTYLQVEGLTEDDARRWVQELKQAQDFDFISFFNQILQRTSFFPKKIAESFTDFIIDHNVLPKKHRPWNGVDSLEDPQDQIQEWLVNQLMPADIWENLILLSPKMEKWHEKMKKELSAFKYSLMLEAMSKFLSGIGLGATISVSTTSSITMAVGLRLLMAAIAKPMSVKAYSPINKMRAFPRIIADEIELILGESQLPDEFKGFDCLIATDAFVENLHQQMVALKDQIGLRMLLAGVVLSHGFLSKDPLSALGVAFTGLIEIKALNKLFNPIIKFADQFNKVELQIRELTEQIKTLSVAAENDPEKLARLEELSIERLELTSAKQNTTNTFQEVIVTSVALLVSRASTVLKKGLGGATLTTVELAGQVTASQQSLVTALNRKKIAERDIEQLRKILDFILKSGDRRRRTAQDEQSERGVDVEQRKNLLSEAGADWTMSSLGIPAIRRPNGDICEKITWVDLAQLFQPGKFSVLMGGNHIGKSTALKTLLGQHIGHPEQTEFQLNGVPFNSLNITEQKRYFLEVPSELSSTDYSLKKMIASILLKYEHTLQIQGQDLDVLKMKSWLVSENDSYPELELAIINYINDLNCGLKITQEWFVGDYQPSGFEQVTLNLALHLLIDEPIMLLIDDPLQKITEENTGYYLQLIKSLEHTPLRAMMSMNQKKPLGEIVGFKNLHSVIDMSMSPNALGVGISDLLKQPHLISAQAGKTLTEGLKERATNGGLTIHELKQLIAWQLLEDVSEKCSLHGSLRSMKTDEVSLEIEEKWSALLKNNFEKWLDNFPLRRKKLSDFSEIIGVLSSVTGISSLILERFNSTPVGAVDSKYRTLPVDRLSGIFSRKEWLSLFYSLDKIHSHEFTLSPEFWKKNNPEELKQNLALIRFILIGEAEFGLLGKYRESTYDDWSQLDDSLGDIAWKIKGLFTAPGGLEEDLEILKKGAVSTAKAFFELPEDKKLEYLLTQPQWLLWGQSLYFYFFRSPNPLKSTLDSEGEKLASPAITRWDLLDLVEKALENFSTLKEVEELEAQLKSTPRPHLKQVISDAQSLMSVLEDCSLGEKNLFERKKKELSSKN